jgi:hypothetical protein
VGNLPYNVEVVVLIIEDKITVEDTEETFEASGLLPYHVWDYTEETPYSVSSPEEFDCQPNRGGTDKPLFLLNHWIERVSPSRVDAVWVNDYQFLLDRAQECAKERGQIPNFVAVNYYLIGDVVDVVDELNGVRHSDQP